MSNSPQVPPTDDRDGRSESESERPSQQSSEESECQATASLGSQSIHCGLTIALGDVQLVPFNAMRAMGDRPPFVPGGAKLHAGESAFEETLAALQDASPAPGNSTVDAQVATTVFQRAFADALAERHMRNARVAAAESAKWSALRDQELMKGLLRIRETDQASFKALKKNIREKLPSSASDTNKRGHGEENAAPNAKRPSLGEGNDGAGPSRSN